MPNTYSEKANAYCDAYSYNAHDEQRNSHALPDLSPR